MGEVIRVLRYVSPGTSRTLRGFSASATSRDFHFESEIGKRGRLESLGDNQKEAARINMLIRISAQLEATSALAVEVDTLSPQKKSSQNRAGRKLQPSVAVDARRSRRIWNRPSETITLFEEPLGFALNGPPANISLDPSDELNSYYEPLPQPYC